MVGIRGVRVVLAMNVAFAVSSVASVLAATDPNAGYDISYPQCNGPFPNGAFGIAGVNGGKPYSANPCLGTSDGPSELSWAGMNAQLYANTADPGPALSSHWPNGQTSPKQCNTASNPGSDTAECHYDYGWNAAADSYQNAVNAYISLGWAPSGAARTPVANQWWLDVETANSWTSTPTLNVQALHGEADYLSSVGAARVGFYSTTSDWQTITGATTSFASSPSWLAGANSLSDAQSRCGSSGFTGGGVTLVQYPAGGFDADYRCTTQSALSFVTAPQTLIAGSPSSPITLQLSQPASAPVTINLTSSSSAGDFSSNSSGPWTASLSLTVPAGSSTTPPFYYQDTRAGSPTLTATAPAYTAATQTESVTAAALASMVVSPSSATVATGGTQTFSASGADAYGNPVDVSSAAWSVSPSSLGTISPSPGSSTTFTAGASAGSGSLIASVGAIQGSASVSVVSAGVPGAPTNLTAAPASGKGVQLSWTAPSNTGGSAITTYKVYRSTSSSGGWAVVASVGATAITYKDTSTRRGATYYYEVTAVNSAGESSPSNLAGPVQAK